MVEVLVNLLLPVSSLWIVVWFYIHYNGRHWDTVTDAVRKTIDNKEVVSMEIVSFIILYQLPIMPLKKDALVSAHQCRLVSVALSVSTCRLFVAAGQCFEQMILLNFCKVFFFLNIDILTYGNTTKLIVMTTITEVVCSIGHYL